MADFKHGLAGYFKKPSGEYGGMVNETFGRPEIDSLIDSYTIRYKYFTQDSTKFGFERIAVRSGPPPAPAKQVKGTMETMDENGTELLGIDGTVYEHGLIYFRCEFHDLAGHTWIGEKVGGKPGEWANKPVQAVTPPK